MLSHYQAEGLTREEVANFCVDFYSLELAIVAIIEIVPNFNNRGFGIKLMPVNSFFDLLDASFRDGNFHQKWGKKFKKMQ